MKIVNIALVFILIVFLGKANGQQTHTDREKFTSSFYKNFRFPRDISEECKSSFVSVILTMKNNTVSKIDFSPNASPSLKAEFDKLKPIFEEANWKRIFPKIGNRKDFTIYLPFIYYFSFECDEKIASKDFRKILEAGFDLEEGERPAYYMLPPIIVEIGKPRA